jgi:hypothetical protein
VEFSCSLSGECWCDAETARLPMPLTGEDCLCRECLRKMAGVILTFSVPRTQRSA